MTTIKMYKYIISYGDGDGDGKKAVRKAQRASSAIQKFCDQYGWSWSQKQIDADTRGLEWAEGYADKQGGINYNMHILASKVSD